jgi:hypothetical protein
MSIRKPNELTAICGASEGHEMSAGLIGGKNGRTDEPDVVDALDERLDDATALGASGDVSAQPTATTLANVSNAKEDFISHLSLGPVGAATMWLVFEQARCRRIGGRFAKAQTFSQPGGRPTATGVASSTDVKNVKWS